MVGRKAISDIERNAIGRVLSDGIIKDNESFGRAASLECIYYLGFVDRKKGTKVLDTENLPAASKHQL